MMIMVHRSSMACCAVHCSSKDWFCGPFRDFYLAQKLCFWTGIIFIGVYVAVCLSVCVCVCVSVTSRVTKLIDRFA